MIRHLAVFRWIEGTTPEQIDALTRGLEALPAQIPSIKRYQFGPDADLGPDRWDYGVTAEFDDAEGYHAYVDHPAHQAVATDLIAPIRAERAHTQIEI